MPEESEGSEGPENLDQPPSFFPYSGQLPEGETRDLGELVEVHIQGVFAADSEQSKSLFVLVSDGDRKLPIVIGPFEAQAISLPLENSQPDRPMTHDLIRNLLDRLDATVERVVIDDLWKRHLLRCSYTSSAVSAERVRDRRSSVRRDRASGPVRCAGVCGGRNPGSRLGRVSLKGSFGLRLRLVRRDSEHRRFLMSAVAHPDPNLCSVK